MDKSDFSNRLFTSQKRDNSELVDILAKHIPGNTSVRILEIGCGTGQLTIALAKLRPLSTIVGLDISPDNIVYAKESFNKGSVLRNVEFIACDYENFDSEQFDFIVMESVFHLMTTSNQKLYAKLSRDLAPGGKLISNMPYDCVENYLLFLFRRLLRIFRGPLLDNLIVAVASFVFRDLDKNVLRERVPYMYLLPTRLDSPAMIHELREEYALDRTQVMEIKDNRLGKPKHRISVFKKLSMNS